MSPVTGQRLGPYEIVAPIGAGGMGEVWRARDTRLDRSVAIKMIPAGLAASAQLRARFEREARSISQLSHPNICALFDVGDDYLVMELLDGESLADRLTRGPLPLEQVLRIGIEVASALHCAHRSGIVHRDLKPGNVMLTKSGAKLLDFGLAKPLTSEAAPLATAAATQQHPLTEEGTIVGTYYYMSPEQLTGGAVDHRSDIFALGALLYEMVTGRRAFEGKTKTSVIASILDRDPPALTTLNAEAPPPLERVVVSCLAKDPDARWQSAHDVALELKALRDGVPSAGAREVAPRTRVMRAAAVALAVALAAAGGFFAARRMEPTRGAVHAGIISPPGLTVTDFVVSPHGDMVAMIAGRSLWLRDLAAATARQVEHSEDAEIPFWSPDGRSVGYFAGGSLYKIAVSGGPPVLIRGDLGFVLGGSWGADDTILLGVTGAAGIKRLSASGGALTPVTTVDARQREGQHIWPSFLPDGRHFLFLSDADAVEDHIIYVASLDAREPRKRLVSGAMSNASYAGGYLLYVKARTLMAQPFDLDRLSVTGAPHPIHDNIADTDFHHYVFSGSPGALGFSTFDPRSRLHLIERSGKETATFGEPADWVSVSWSPDGRRCISERVDSERRMGTLWMADLMRGVINEFVVDRPFAAVGLWSADSSQVLYTADPKGTETPFFMKRGDGSGDRNVTTLTTPGYPSSWAGDWVAIERPSGASLADVIAVSISSGKQITVAHSPLWENDAAFSADGRWIAYQVNGKIVVKPFPPTGAQFTVSSVPGAHPRWRGDGRELFYAGERGIYAIPIEAKGMSLEAGIPQLVLAATLKPYKNRAPYDVSPDGKRFLLNIQDNYDQPAHLILDWTSTLRQ